MWINLKDFSSGELIFSFDTSMVPEVGELLHYDCLPINEKAILKVVKVDRFINLYNGGVTQEYLNIDVTIVKEEETNNG